MSERKRKRSEEQEVQRSREQNLSQKIKVSHLQDCGEHLPVLVSSSGIRISSDLSFDAYENGRPSFPQTSTAKSEILLHSSQHPSLDFLAREDKSIGSDIFLNHYVGIFDPSRSHLQIIPARKSHVRGTLRQAQELEESPSKNKTASNLSARNKLGMEFGTKKKQRAIQSMAANAIQASPQKSTQNGVNGSSQPLDASSQAVIDSMAEPTSSMPTRKELQQTIDDAKARPKPHLDAASVSEIYPLEELLGGLRVLEKIAVQEWIDSVQNGDDVPTRSLFVSRRLIRKVEAGQVKEIKVLRYLLLLIEWYKSLRPTGKKMLQVPKTESMGSLITSFGSELVSGLWRRFSENGSLNQWRQHYLLTHILALTLHVDNFVSDTYHISQDLRLEQRVLSKLYSELGCPLRPPTVRERDQLGIKQAEASAHRHAQLKIPPTFPKGRQR